MTLIKFSHNKRAIDRSMSLAAKQIDRTAKEIESAVRETFRNPTPVRLPRSSIVFLHRGKLYFSIGTRKKQESNASEE